MTGKDLIMYVLRCNLENEQILKVGESLKLITTDEVAAETKVGPATIRVWHERGDIPGIKIDNSLYFLKRVVEEKEDCKIE